jgi:hypothetical protein
MRAIRRFPLPDSHVSLSAVLEPGPNAQPAPPPRPTTGQSNLPHNQGPSHPKPTLTDTPRHYDPPLPRTRPLTSLADKPHHPNRCEFETWRATSTPPTRFNHQPTPPIAHDTRPSRHKSTQLTSPPEPTTNEQKPVRLRKFFRPKLQPPPQSGVRPPRHPIDQDNAATPKPLRLGLRRSAFQGAVRPAN